MTRSIKPHEFAATFPPCEVCKSAGKISGQKCPACKGSGYAVDWNRPDLTGLDSAQAAALLTPAGDRR